MSPDALHITGDEHADRVLTDDPLALLVGMLLDQQYPMEHAFRGPAKILDRFGTLDPATIAAADPEEFAVMASTPPAIHRYGRSMAGRVQAVAQIVTDLFAQVSFLIDHLDCVKAERFHARTVAVLELAILIFWCVNFVAAAILISMNPACRIFFHEDYWINVLASAGSIGAGV